MIFNALSNAAYFVSLQGPGAELEGFSNIPQARRVLRWEPAGVPARVNIPLSFDIFYK